MRTHVQKTALTILPLAGWLFTAPVVFADDLTAEHTVQNAVRQELKADRQEVQEEQRIERQTLKEEQRAERKGLRTKQEQQEAERRVEKAQRQEQKDAARATIHKEELAKQNARLRAENVE
jgi:hypothetical protein